MLRRAVAAGYSDAPLMHRDVDLDPLRDRPDFRALMLDLAMPAFACSLFDEICISESRASRRIGSRFLWTTAPKGGFSTEHSAATLRFGSSFIDARISRRSVMISCNNLNSSSAAGSVHSNLASGNASSAMDFAPSV